MTQNKRHLLFGVLLSGGLMAATQPEAADAGGKAPRSETGVAKSKDAKGSRVGKAGGMGRIGGKPFAPDLELGKPTPKNKPSGRMQTVVAKNSDMTFVAYDESNLLFASESAPVHLAAATVMGRDGKPSPQVLAISRAGKVLARRSGKAIGRTMGHGVFVSTYSSGTGLSTLGFLNENVDQVAFSVQIEGEVLRAWHGVAKAGERVMGFDEQDRAPKLAGTPVVRFTRTLNGVTTEGALILRAGW